MYCPKCSTKINLDEQSVRIDNALNENSDPELFICKGCKLKRPLVWWQSVELDVNIELKFEEKEVEETFQGGHEIPWSD